MIPKTSESATSHFIRFIPLVRTDKEMALKILLYYDKNFIQTFLIIAYNVSLVFLHSSFSLIYCLETDPKSFEILIATLSMNNSILNNILRDCIIKENR